MPTINDRVNVLCGNSIYGGKYVALNGYRIAGSKAGGSVDIDINVTYKDIACAFSKSELELMLAYKHDEYAENIKRIDSIFDAKPGTDEGTELSRLVKAVEEYEKDIL